MKRIIVGLAAVTCFCFADCGGGPDPSKPSAKGMMEIDLSEWGIPVTMMVPDSTKAPLDIQESAAAGIVIRVGKSFQVEIAEDGDLAMRKDDLQTGPESLVYVATTVSEGSDFIVYQQEVKDSEMAPKFRFYYIFESEGMSYGVQDFDEGGPYVQGAVEKMLDAAKSVKGKSTS